MSDLPGRKDVVQGFLNRHSLSDNVTPIAVVLEPAIYWTDATLLLLQLAFAGASEMMLSDPTSGLLFNMLNRNFEAVEGAIVAFLSECGPLSFDITEKIKLGGIQMTCTRRMFAMLGATALASPRRLPSQTPAKAPKAAASSATAESWMDELGVRAPVGGLYLGRFKDPMYFVTKEIKWQPNPGQEKYHEVSVPVGFVTDLASIPRLFWSLLRPDGSYAYAAIVHDYLYWFQTRSREESDTILKLAMQDFSVPPLTTNTIYEAVRVGGGAAWDENRRLRNSGEKRVLKRFPEDPRVTWAEWKSVPGVLV